MSRTSLAILISGSGTNLQAFIDAIADCRLGAEIVVVISNRPDAYGLQRARDAGIPAVVVDHREFASRDAFDRSLAGELHRHNPDLVILAGFMRILTPAFVEDFSGRLLNIHPSLLPKYPGLNTHQQALDANDTQAGATVHFVTAELDGGPPIVQAAVDIEPSDSAASLADKIRPLEHAIYIQAVKWYVEGRLELLDDSVRLDGETLPETGVRLEPNTH